MERSLKPIRRVCFGEFEVDFLDRSLYRQGLKIKINERPLQVLSLLVARPGEVVRREEFQQTIWPSDANVDFSANLNTALTSLRRALLDSPRNPVFIKTVPRHGYRFIAPVVWIEDDRGSLHVVPRLLTTIPESAGADTPEREQRTMLQRFMMIFRVLLTLGLLAR
ncbi:MAG: winged helix-turn-helix domain-containing protein [Candidatus Acidiferrales bacterium]